MFQGIQCVVQGADHIKKGMICQDAADYKASEHYGIAVAADGHGSAKYIRSDIGSKKAVQCAIGTVSQYMEDYDRFSRKIRENSGYVLRKMSEHFLASWTAEIEDYHDANPLTEKEKEILRFAGADESSLFTYYGSTVLIAVLAEDYYYGMLVGDGGFVVIDENGTAGIPIEDKNSRANYTSSICSKNSIDSVESFFAEGKPLAMCVSTDGLIKSFGCEEDFLDYHVLLAPMLNNVENCQVSLLKNLNKRTSQGSGDDISISVIFESGRIADSMELLKQVIAESRARKKVREEQEALERKKFQEQQERRRQQILKDELAEMEKKKKHYREIQKKIDRKEKEAQKKLEEAERLRAEAQRSMEEAQKRRSDLDNRMEEKSREFQESEKRIRSLREEVQNMEKPVEKSIETILKTGTIMGAKIIEKTQKKLSSLLDDSEYEEQFVYGDAEKDDPFFPYEDLEEELLPEKIPFVQPQETVQEESEEVPTDNEEEVKE